MFLQKDFLVRSVVSAQQSVPGRIPSETHQLLDVPILNVGVRCQYI
jgi:hypothetical protein